MRSASLLLNNYCTNYKGLPYAAWQGISIGFIESTLVGICYFLSLYFVTELHLSLVNAGFLISAYGLGTILGSIIAGKLSDQFSPRFVTIISLLIQAVSYFLLIKIHTPSLLLINLFILGIGSYGFITSNYLWTLGNCKSEERLKAINMLDIVSNLGLAIAGIIIGFASTQRFVNIFFLSSCALCIMAVYLIFYSKQSQIITNVISSNNNSSSSVNLKIKYYALACLFLVGLIISQVHSTYPVFLQRSFPEMGTMSFSILFILNATLIVLFQAPLVNSLANVNKIFLIGMGAFLLGLGMALLNFSFFFAIAILSCLITTLGEILFFSIAQLICYEKSPEKKKGLGLGTYRMIYAASRVAGPAAGGLVYQQSSAQELWLICFLLGVTCFIPSFYFKKLY
jgi:MFS family permease